MTKTNMTVEKTTDYKMFKRISTNRRINLNHLLNLVDRIKEKNLLYASPIIVNGKYQVIDGQHRLAAAERIAKDEGEKIEIYYIVVDGLETIDMQILNTTNKNWLPEDFLEHFISLKNPNYIVYKEFMIKYQLTHAVVQSLLFGEGMRGNMVRTFREGKFVASNIEEAEIFAEQIRDFSEYYPGWKRKEFGRSCLIMFRYEAFNSTTGLKERYEHKRMMLKMRTESAELRDSGTIRGYLEMFTRIYNKKEPQKDILRFV